MIYLPPNTSFQLQLACVPLGVPHAPLETTVIKLKQTKTNLLLQAK